MQRLITFSSIVLCAACGADSIDVDASAGTCFELHQARIAVNGASTQGESLNGKDINGRDINGKDINGKDLNGISMQGWALNGIQNNGIPVNGKPLNVRAIGAGALELARVHLDGGRLVAELDGERLPDDVFVGATFTSAGKDGATLRIASVTLDDVDQRLAWYELDVVGGGPLCARGNEKGVFVAGSFDDRGAYHPAADGTSYACADGVMNKCIAWGYSPWATSDDAYQTCTRLARADYCGDGVPWTQNGTLIDVYDDLGVQERAGSLTFEAGWSVDGATCVAAPRYSVQDAAGNAIRPTCWDALARCGSLDEAQALGALLANDSAHTPIQACSR